MRQQKTSKKNRDTYIYYGADGKKIMELIPGEDGVTEALIAMLHEADDEEFNSNRRQDYLAPVHYQAYRDGEGNDAEDRNDYLVDDRLNPEEDLIDRITRAERSDTFRNSWDKLLPHQRDLIKKKEKEVSNVDIAAEEKVTEAAIRSRLKKIQKKFKNLR